MIHQWKKAFLDGAVEIFELGSTKAPQVDKDTLRTLHAKIGDLSVGAQCQLLSIYQKPNTSKPTKGHKSDPYLLGGLWVERPKQF